MFKLKVCVKYALNRVYTVYTHNYIKCMYSCGTQDVRIVSIYYLCFAGLILLGELQSKRPPYKYTKRIKRFYKRLMKNALHKAHAYLCMVKIKLFYEH